MCRSTISLYDDDGDAGNYSGTNCLVEYTPVQVPPPPEAIMSFDGTGPRLMITHIVNENFKSYAGVQTLGPFHKVIFINLSLTFTK